MVKLTDIELQDDNHLTERQLCEMAMIKPYNSGIPVIMYALPKDSVKGQHWARIKVSNIAGSYSEDDNFVVSISETPQVMAGKCKFKAKVLNRILAWVQFNYEPLMKYWNDEYENPGDFYDELRRV